MAGKGDKRRRATISTAQFEENFNKIFGVSKEKTTGRFKLDKETNKLIPSYEWYEKYGDKTGKTHYVMGDIEPYQSPVDNKVINSRKDYRDDLKRNNCRTYEGYEQEKKYADIHNQEKEKKNNEIISNGIEKTYYELRDGMIKPEKSIKPSWLLGQD